MEKKRNISIVVNGLIVVMVALATVWMMAGFYFMAPDTTLSQRGLWALQYFTVQSNLLLGLASLIYIIDILRKGRISLRVYRLKHAATTAVMVTMMTVLCFLAPLARDGFFSLFRNSNLFFHLIIPVTGIVSFVFLEKQNDQPFSVSLTGLVPLLIYAVYYVGNILIHFHDKDLTLYDWYGFLRFGNEYMIVAIVVMVCVTYLFSFLLYRWNQESVINNRKNS